MYINISALTMEEAEIMLKVLDQWLRNHYNTYGVHRMTSFNRKANDGFRAQIRGEVDWEMFDYVRDGVMWEIVHRFGKGVSYHTEKINDLRVIELSTAEVTI